jgi:hypothetical protein
MRCDVSVGVDGEPGTWNLDVLVGDHEFQMDYDDAEMLRDKLTDALEFVDDCARAREMKVAAPTALRPGYPEIYLRSERWAG